jgi:hypothetical protein
LPQGLGALWDGGNVLRILIDLWDTYS